MGTYIKGKAARFISFRQERPRPGLKGVDPEDTSEFPVQAPFVAGIRHNRSSIAPPEPARAAQKTQARGSLDEITHEFPLQKRRGENLRGVEMMEIWLVQHRLSGRLGDIFPEMSYIALMGLKFRLELAARDARAVPDGMSPKREFFARLPGELLGAARMMYRAVDCSPRMF